MKGTFNYYIVWQTNSVIWRHDMYAFNWQKTLEIIGANLQLSFENE